MYNRECNEILCCTLRSWHLSLWSTGNSKSQRNDKLEISSEKLSLFDKDALEQHHRKSVMEKLVGVLFSHLFNTWWTSFTAWYCARCFHICYIVEHHNRQLKCSTNSSILCRRKLTLREIRQFAPAHSSKWHCIPLTIRHGCAARLGSSTRKFNWVMLSSWMNWFCSSVFVCFDHTSSRICCLFVLQIQFAN